MSIDKAKATELRKPFPRESIGKLPKGGMMLDYVGHAAVTERLLTVDPEWSWEPFALGDDGLPALDRHNNLWIRLTICGVTRIGVGDGKSAKECIGDAIRNAAMRFGVALDLWAKENLVEFEQAIRHDAAPAVERPAPESAPETHTAPLAAADDAVSKPRLMTKIRRGELFALFAQKGIAESDQLAGVNHINGTAHESRSQILEAEAIAAIKVLRTRPDAAVIEDALMVIE